MVSFILLTTISRAGFCLYKTTLPGSSKFVKKIILSYNYWYFCNFQEILGCICFFFQSVRWKWKLLPSNKVNINSVIFQLSNNHRELKFRIIYLTFLKSLLIYCGLLYCSSTRVSVLHSSMRFPSKYWHWGMVLWVNKDRGTWHKKFPNS